MYMVMKGRICLMHLSEKILKKDYVTVSEILRESTSIAKIFRDINGKYATQKHTWISTESHGPSCMCVRQKEENIWTLLYDSMHS